MATVLLREQLIVGDVVVVERATGVNDAHARAVVVERYVLGNRPGWTLLFNDGQHDGFSPDDCAICGVRRVGHEPSVADYVFRSALQLLFDFERGRFAVVWAH